LRQATLRRNGVGPSRAELRFPKPWVRGSSPPEGMAIDLRLSGPFGDRQDRARVLKSSRSAPQTCGSDLGARRIPAPVRSPVRCAPGRGNRCTPHPSASSLGGAIDPARLPLSIKSPSSDAAGSLPRLPPQILHKRPSGYQLGKSAPRLPGQLNPKRGARRRHLAAQANSRRFRKVRRGLRIPA
jgi:hypothetical protein